MKKLLTSLAAAIVLVPLGPVLAGEADVPVDVLLFTETAGFRHASIPDGIAAFQRIAAQDAVPGVDVRVTLVEDSAGQFTDADLAQYEVVAFLSTTGNTLDTTEQAAFERYVQAGGGYLGVHAAVDSEYAWPWYGDLAGAYFTSHPTGTPAATLDVEDTGNASTAHLPTRWTRNDEWYNFRRNPRKYVCNTEPEALGVETQTLTEPVPTLNLPFPLGNAQSREVAVPEEYDDRPQDCGVHVLLTLDESTYSNQLYTGQDARMGDHPIAWCHEYDGGRSFYTGLGHTSESWTEPAFVEHLKGGVLVAAGLAECGPGSADPTD